MDCFNNFIHYDIDVLSVDLCCISSDVQNGYDVHYSCLVELIVWQQVDLLSSVILVACLYWWQFLLANLGHHLRRVVGFCLTHLL